MRAVVVPTYFSQSEPIGATLHQYAAAGVRLVEVHGDAPQTHIDLRDAADVKALAALVQTLPLEVRSVHCPYSQPSEEAWDVSQPDEGKRSAALRSHSEVIRSSTQLGAHHVVVHPEVRRRDSGRLAHSRASLAQLTEIARDAGMRIAVENLPSDFLGGSLAKIECMLDGLDATVVGLCLDTGHAMLGEDSPGDYARALGGHIFGLHWHANDGSTDAHLLPNFHEGTWDEFFAALDEAGCSVPVTLEVEVPSATTLEEAIQSIRAALQGSRKLRFR